MSETQLSNLYKSTSTDRGRFRIAARAASSPTCDDKIIGKSFGSTSPASYLNYQMFETPLT
jgi:hypothetical protein